jgi:histone-lysine N-methyltransferase SUV39H
VGELIAEAEADKRGAKYDSRGLSYLYNLDGFCVGDSDGVLKCDDEGYGQDINGNKLKMYVLDADIKGNVARFVNHSCEPNIYIHNVRPHPLRDVMSAS